MLAWICEYLLQPFKMYFIGLGISHSLKHACTLAVGLDGFHSCFRFCCFGLKLLERELQFTVLCVSGRHVSVLVH